AHQPRAHRREDVRRRQDQGRRHQDGVPAVLPVGRHRLRRSERQGQPRGEARRGRAQLRAARGHRHAAAHDVPRGGPEPESGVGEIAVQSTEYPPGDVRIPAPLVGPGHTSKTITDKLVALVLTKNTPMAWFAFTAVGFTLLMALTVSVAYLL